MIFIRALLFIFYLFILPFCLGTYLFSILDLFEDRRIIRIPFSYLIGILLIMAEFEFLAVPLIRLNRSLTSLVIAMCLAMIWTFFILWMLAMVHSKKASKKIFTEHPFTLMKSELSNRRSLILIIEIAVLALFIFMLSKYLFFMHIDDDDSRFIGNAMLAYEHDEMFRYDWGTGAPDTTDYTEIQKDLSSPWVMFYAMLGRLTMTDPTIIAHGIMAPVLFCLGAIAYYLLADSWMKKDRVKIAWLLLFIEAVLLTFGGNTHTIAAVSLVRIWQGKAVVAAVSIPLLYTLYGMLCHSTENRSRIYILFLITCQASCLFSGVGIVISGLVTGPFCLWDVIMKKRWREIPWIILCCLPTLIYGFMYARL